MADYTDVIASLLGGGLAVPPGQGPSAYSLPAITGASGFGLAPIAGAGAFDLPAIGGAGAFDLPAIGGGGGLDLPAIGGLGSPTYSSLYAIRKDRPEEPGKDQAGKPGAITRTPPPGATGRTPGAPVPSDVSAISLSGLGPGQRDEFWKRAMTLGVYLEKQTGIPAEVFAAMAANESNFGNAPGNIMGGVKAAPGDPNAITLDTWEMVNGQRVPMRQSFVASPSALAGMQTVAQTLQSGRYAPAYQALVSGAIDRDEFLRRVNAAGYATNPNWAQGEIVPLMGEASRYRAQAEATHADIAARNMATASTAVSAEAAVQANTGALRGVSQNTYAAQNGLPRDIAAAICGPAAVDAFARNMGRNPGPAEAFELARSQNLWDLNSGAHGPDSMVTLLGRLGVPARTTAPAADTVATEVQRGHMVIIDTPQHYYQVTGYNPATQQFQFGDAVGANRWATLDQLPAWGYGAARTAIVSKE